MLYGLTVTFAMVDWTMSVNPHWFSTIWGLLYIGGQGLSAMAFAIVILIMLSETPPLNRVVTPHHLHDLGKLLFAFLMLWAYLSFSQFLIIWSANLAEEIPHYLTRVGRRLAMRQRVRDRAAVRAALRAAAVARHQARRPAAADHRHVDPDDAHRRLLLAGGAGVPQRPR